MDPEVRLRADIDTALAGKNPPPLGSLVEDALTSGVKLRRRRRSSLVTACSAGVAVLAVAGAIIVATGGVRTDQLSVRPGDPSATATAPGPGPSAHEKAVTGEAVVAMLRQALPPGGSISELYGAGRAYGATAGFLYDDGHGAATVSGIVSDGSPGTAGSMQCLEVTAGGAYQCQHSTTADGGEVKIESMGPYTTDCTDAKCSIASIRVSVRRPAGFYVIVQAYNGPFGGSRPATRTGTLLTQDQLLALANDPRWGLTMDAAFVDAAGRAVTLPPAPG